MIDFDALPRLEGPLLTLVLGNLPRQLPVDQRSIKERLAALSRASESAGGDYGATALRDELEALRGATKGTRNHALNKAAFSLHQLAQEGHLDPGEVDTRLREAALAMGLSSHEVEQTLASGRRGAAGRPRPADRLPEQKVPDQPRGGVKLGARRISPSQGPSTEGDEEEVPEFLRRLQLKTYTLETVQYLPDPVPLIDECLMQDSLVVLWGPPASKKSFLAIDIGLCVASGTWWHGRRVRSGCVVHFAGEGAHGIKNRVAAWMEDQGMMSRHWPWHLVGQAFNILDPQQEQYALLHLQMLAPSLVILDTLARHTPGADENSAQDWGRMIQVLDLIRDACPGACVIVIHHGNAEGAKMRGHTSLLGAADTSIKLTSDDVTTLVEWEKVKDAPRPMALKLYTKAVGKSIVLSDQYPHGGEPPVQGVEAVARELSMVALTGASVDELSRATGMPSIAVKRALNELARRGEAELKGPGSWRPVNNH